MITIQFYSYNSILHQTQEGLHKIIYTLSIALDKKNNTFSKYIELKGKKQEKLFENILIIDDKEN